MVAPTSLMLFAGRFGLASSSNRKATVGRLKLEVREFGLQTSRIHSCILLLLALLIILLMSVGVVLGLKNIGTL